MIHKTMIESLHDTIAYLSSPEVSNSKYATIISKAQDLLAIIKREIEAQGETIRPLLDSNASISVSLIPPEGYVYEDDPLAPPEVIVSWTLPSYYTRFSATFELDAENGDSWSLVGDVSSVVEDAFAINGYGGFYRGDSTAKFVAYLVAYMWAIYQATNPPAT